MRRPARRSFALFLLAAVSAGCAPGDEPSSPGDVGASAGAAAVADTATPPHRPDAPDGIAWYPGSVEDAFAAAAASGRPVFLFWGAAWCPYCADLKAHVFTRRDFQERLKLFVPVYLDGDDSGAQRWGEEFGVQGYPTVLALAPDRTELARIAGGMDSALYAEMLDLVLADARPIRDLLRAVDEGDGTLPLEDCRRLAYNGWGLDEPDAGAAALAASLAKASSRCPPLARVERARLAAIALSYAVEAEADAIGRGENASPLLRDLLASVAEVVDDRPLAVTVADALQYLDEQFFTVARQALGPGDLKRLLDSWSGAMRAAAHDPRYTEGDRLLAMRSLVYAARAQHDGVPPEIRSEAHALLEAALARSAGTSARAGAVNAAVNLLVALDEPERAYEIAADAMRTSATPYYQMADLAMLEERLGDFAAAVDWLERAYRESAGAATRFQWGANYVRGLIRMRPDDEDAIRDAALEVLGELEGPDRIYRRTRGRLATLDAALREWGALPERADAIAAIRARMEEVCAGIPAEETRALESCRAFLAPDQA